MKSLTALGLVLSLSSLAFSSAALADDQILVLSGGGSPNGNHYSQYLQTKTLFDGLRTQVPETQISVYFGAGNASGQSPVLADVHRLVSTLDGKREVMTAGYLDRNQAASKSNVLSYFDQPARTTMSQGDTLFLLVSDHGMPNRDADGNSDKTFSNNCIDLWGFKADLSDQSFGSVPFPERCLSKNELANKLNTKVTAGRVVFAMSQCYSGGFHQMSVNHSGKYPTANPRICGFTAITEDTTASGCTPDVDGPGYQGYERYFTQQVTGVDVVSGKQIRPAKKSLMAAHRAAAVEDLTVDIPLSTSDYYLWKWFGTIASQQFTPRTGTLTADQARRVAVENSVLGARLLNDKNYVSKDAFFFRMEREFARLYPEYREFLRGDLKKLEQVKAEIAAASGKLDAKSEQVSTQLSQSEETLLKAWSVYVASGQSGLSDYEKTLESDVFAGPDYQDGYGMGNFLSVLFMSIKAIVQPERAEAISKYKATRLQLALNWALSNPNSQLQDLAQRIQTSKAQVDKLDDESFALSKRHGHVRRLLIYRQVIGAWNALAAMNDTQALNEVQALIECEKTKLP